MSMPSRFCQQCRTQLAPGQVYCGNCGTYNALPVESLPNQQPFPPNPYMPQQPVGNNPYANTSYGAGAAAYPPTPPIPNAGYPYGGSQPQVPYAPIQVQQPYGAQPQPYLQGQVQQPYNQGMYNNAAPLPGVGYAPIPQVPQQRKGSNPLLLIGGGLLLLLLIGSGLLVLPKIHDATTTTGVATPTITPTQQPLFSDTFADNSKNWDVASGTGFSATIGNSTLNMTDKNHRILFEQLPTTDAYNDFRVTATFTLNKGDKNDSAGFFLRASRNNHQGYYVDVYSDGAYDIEKESPDSTKASGAKIVYLVDPTNTPSLLPAGRQNTLTVIMKGSTIIVMSGQTVLKTVTDSSYTNGSIYLFAANGDTSSGVDVSYDSVQIYPTPNQLPT